MSKHGNQTAQAFGMGSDIPTSESGPMGGRPMGVDLCGTMMRGAMPACPCSLLAKRHPVVTFMILTIMGLFVLVIPTGAILGIIAFLRTL